MRTVHNLDDRIKIIGELIKHDLFDAERAPMLRELVGQIVKTCPCRGDAGERAAGACELFAVFEWCVTNIRYSGDLSLKRGEGMDLYSSPLRTIQAQVADCDDHVGVCIALLRMLGYYCIARVCAYGSGSEWQHIYCVVKEFPRVGPDREVVFDVTLGHGKVGVERPYVKKIDYEI
jgi:hypothetical protein